VLPRYFYGGCDANASDHENGVEFRDCTATRANQTRFKCLTLEVISCSFAVCRTIVTVGDGRSSMMLLTKLLSSAIVDLPLLTYTVIAS
jgi:hypothetical protein